MSNHDKDQQEWEQYLSGNSDLSHAYRRASSERSPDQLDQHILKTAQEAGKSSRKAHGPFGGSWMIPVSLAAILILTVTIVPLMRDTLTTPRPNEPAVSQVKKPALSNAPNNLSKAKPSIASPAPASKTFVQQNALKKDHEVARQLEVKNRHILERKQERMRAQRSKTLDSYKAEGTAAARLKLQPSNAKESLDHAPKSLEKAEEKTALTPEKWLQEIRNLLDAGKHEEAIKSLETFRKKYPDYPIEKILGPEYKGQ